MSLKSTVNEAGLKLPLRQDRSALVERQIEDLLGFSDFDGQSLRILVFVTDSDHSEHDFQLAMHIAKCGRLVIEIVQVIADDVVVSSLLPEIVTLDAAGIPFEIRRSELTLREEIRQYYNYFKESVIYLIDIGLESQEYLANHWYCVFDSRHPCPRFTIFMHKDIPCVPQQ